MKSSKLILKKEKVASLSNQEMGSLNGGKAQLALDAGGSTEHNFTCGLCTGTQTREATCAQTCGQATCSIMTGPCL